MKGIVVACLLSSALWCATLACESGVHAAPLVPQLAPIDPDALEDMFVWLEAKLDQPLGLIVSYDIPAIGLAKGDLLLMVDGVSALSLINTRVELGSSSAAYLEVLRNGQTIVVRVPLDLRHVAGHIMRDELATSVAAVDTFTQITRNGKPAGVSVGSAYTFRGLIAGDVIRVIGGTAIATVDEARAALTARAQLPILVFDADRMGQPLTLTLVIDDPNPLPPYASVAMPVSTAGIKQIDATTYELPRALVAALTKNGMIPGGARLVPVVKDGRPAGFKLYSVRPGSVLPALGLVNGDTVTMVNGFSLGTANHALEIYSKVRDAQAFTLTIIRHGAILTLNYRAR